MKDLNIDIETYSNLDLKKCGLYKYSEDESFDLLLFAFSRDFEEVEVVDIKRGEKIPEDVLEALADDGVIKHAYNAAFEYNCLKALGFDVGTRKGWRCTMFHAMYLGLPSGLASTGEALGIAEDKKKSRTGTALINFFSKPCKPTEKNGGRLRNLPEDDLEKWEQFKDYCRQDVVSEMEIYYRISQFKIPEKEWLIWRISDEMNALGVGIDLDLVEGAIEIDERLTEEQMERSREISGLSNPNSTAQILSWLQKYLPEVDNVRKATVSDLLKREDLASEVREFLELRQELSKTSVKKYRAMEDCAGKEQRARGLLQVYGANRTGRWAGRLVQVQNLPRNYLSTLRAARDLTKARDIEGLRMIYGNVTDTISQLIRTAFVPQKGRKFVISDYSAIEARVVAWLAGEEWVNDVFRTHGKIYEATASQMFGVPVERIVKGNPEYALRQKGKVATLALGYQGGVGALIAMGGERMGLDENEMEEIKDKWRKSNPNIVALWGKMERAAIRTVKTGETSQVNGKLEFNLEASSRSGLSFMTIKLPSGRKLFYPQPEISTGSFGNEAVYFMGIGLNRKLKREQTYGGKLTENVVQAIARDCLSECLINLYREYKDAPVVMHIHDEVVLEAESYITVDEINDVMARDIDWAEGLVLRGAGFETEFYMKD